MMLYIYILKVSQKSLIFNNIQVLIYFKIGLKVIYLEGNGFKEISGL